MDVRALLGTAAIGAVALSLVVLPFDRATADGSPRAGSASVSLRVEGMTCASCRVAVRTALTKVEGVKDAKVDVAKHSAVVEYDPAKVTPQQLVDAVNGLGYEASLFARGGS